MPPTSGFEEIPLQLTLLQLEALRDHLNEFCTEYPHSDGLNEVWQKVGAIDEQLKAARKLQRFSGQD